MKAKNILNSESCKNSNDKYIFPPIAIVGMASLYPGSRSLREYWNNIISKKDCITSIEEMDPFTYWNKDDYYSNDPNDSQNPDKTTCYRAGFIPPIEFDPIEFKTPPVVLDAISTIQLFSLYVAKMALQDAGLLNTEMGQKYKDKTGVILGVAGNGNTAFLLAKRLDVSQYEKMLRNAGLPEKITNHLINKLESINKEWHEDSFAGFLGNVVSGRISNHFELGGTNYTVDAACASSLAAIKTAISELILGNCDVVLTGGANVDNSIFSFLCFGNTHTLSPTNSSRPYDINADGILIGDGVGILVLKRLETAIKDGDRIYAVIRSIASSSDGGAKSIFAPSFDGQVKALESAYEKSGISPSEVQLVEGHGTGTIMGDLTEFNSMCNVYQNAGTPKQSVALGSVKSQIGHTRVAAGAASTIKAALSLYHKVLPPTINIEKPNPQFDIENSPFYLNTETRPWIRTDNTPRRAAVSGFGFGGTNFHMVMEEYEQEHHRPYRFISVPYVVAVWENSPKALYQKCLSLLNEFQSANGKEKYKEYLESLKSIKIPNKNARLAFVSTSLSQTCELLKSCILMFENNTNESWNHPDGIYFRANGKSFKGKVVAVFPGQASQYVNMALRLSQNYPEMRTTFEKFNEIMKKHNNKPISSVVYPIPTFDNETLEMQIKTLNNTIYAQPAICAVTAGMYKILTNAGLSPDFFIGHSLGELSALWAAGVIDENTYFNLAVLRGILMNSSSSSNDMGAMLALHESIDVAETILKSYKNIIIANYNSPKQLILAGSKEVINLLHSSLKKLGKKSSLLPVSAAFHSPYMEEAKSEFYKQLQNFNLESPKRPVFSTCNAEKYPDNPEEIKRIISNQITSPVLFYQTVNEVYENGGYLFIEIGPKGIMGKLIDEILEGKDHVTVSINPSCFSDDEFQYRQALAKLLVEGLHINISDPYNVPNTVEPPERSELTIRLDGGNYFSKEKRVLIEQMINDNDSELFSQYINELYKAWEVKMMKDAHMETLALFAEAQKRMNEVQKQFQENESRYLEILSNLIERYNEIINKHAGSPDFAEIMNSMKQIFSMIKQNQADYHENHRKHLENQAALLGIDLSSNGSQIPGRSINIEEYTTQLISNTHFNEEFKKNYHEPYDNKTNQKQAFDEQNSDKQIKLKNEEKYNIKSDFSKEFSSPLRNETNSSFKASAEIFDEKQFTETLIKIISEKTGYPEDMIDVDMDLEADLGIDSIKRLEILGELSSFISELGEQYDSLEYQGGFDSIDVHEYNTVRKIVESTRKALTEKQKKK